MQRIFIFSIGFSFLLYLIRVCYTGSFLFLFIPWNLLLAWLPYFFSSKLKDASFRLHNIVLFGLWLLFFPNSPYLITDLFHLHQRAEIPLYYDLVLLFMAAWNGLMMGLFSLRNIECILLQRYSAKKVNVLIVCFMVLCGFGIYLGRYDRYNSWHILTQPFDLLHGITNKLLSPLEYPRVWFVTVLFTVVLLLMYKTLKKMPALFGEQASVTKSEGLKIEA